MLRRLRVTIAAIVLIGCGVLFVGGEQAALLLAKPFLFFQFTPSLINFVVTAGGFASIGFLIVLLLSIVLGRVYCACLCPLGILQDVFGFLNRFRKKKPYSDYHPPYSGLRYTVLSLTILSALSGTFALLNALDPYSLFGRLTVHFLTPAIAFVNNQIVALLELFDIYALSPLTIPRLSAYVLGFSLLFFGILLGLSLRQGRIYCNTICPVGTLLGLLSRVSLFKIKLDTSACISCGLCERTCRANCIDISRYAIDASRCVMCFDCMSVCPKSAVTYTFVYKQSSPQSSSDIDLSRRKWLVGAASAAGSIVLSVPLRAMLRPLIPDHRSTLAYLLDLERKALPIIPPGAGNLERFTTTCSACHLCVRACPSQVIQPGIFEYGLRGVLQPIMDYRKGYCDYECHTCGQVCPTGAIAPLPLADKQLIQIGKVRLIKEHCIVYDRKEECSACAEVCPTHAVYTVEQADLGNLLAPETKVEHCIGCGACEFVCPVLSKAIQVDGRAVHEIAEPPFYPEEPAQEDTSKEEEEFPF